jgi:hypothetical protein
MNASTADVEDTFGLLIAPISTTTFFEQYFERDVLHIARNDASRSCANARAARTLPIDWSTIGRCGSAICTEPVRCASSIAAIESGATSRTFLAVSGSV